MRIGVIGIGPVGMTIAVKLGLAGHDIHVHSWDKAQMDELSRMEVDLSGVFDDRFQFQHVHPEIDDFLKYDYDVICLAVKTPSLLGLLELLDQHGLRDTPILSCQNGIGTEDAIAERFGGRNALRLVINFAGNALEYCTIKVQFFHAPNYISAVDSDGYPLARSIAAELSSSGLDTEFTENILGHVYQKGILNCSLSGICALTRLSMDKAMSDPDLVDMVKQLILEGMKIAHLEGAPLGDNYFTRAMEYLSQAGNHKPSMLTDIERGSPTEIDFLNHRLLQLGRKHNVHLPFTNSITALVRGLDESVRLHMDGIET